MIVILFLACVEEKRETLETEVIDSNPSNVDNDLDGYLLSEDCDDNDSFINPGMIEVCDGVDNNCDGNVDENVLTRFYLDSDGDGYGLSENFIELCEAPVGYVRNGNDCDDTDDGRYPGAIEFCDNIDNNCNDEIDEELGEIWYLDADDDGFGIVEQSIQSCEQPEGYILQGGDCQDDNNLVFPGQLEVCDSIDNNCDGLIDEIGNILWYLDSDNDGYGDPNSILTSCTQPEGYLDNQLDCDDNNSEIHPLSNEFCNGIDNNCNGILGDNAIDAPVWYGDQDLDGYGTPDVTTKSCSQPPGYSPNSDDCDDLRFETSPSRQEYCNEIDDDCDGDVDESAIDAMVFFSDVDGDGYGDFNSPISQCFATEGLVENNTDCNDDPSTDGSSMYPYATEYCNDKDDNCNSAIDEMAVDRQNYYLDEDGDGYGSSQFQLACTPPAGFVQPQYDSSGLILSDCNDDPNLQGEDIFPTASEICNERDDDCNGFVDEGIPTELWYADLDGDGYGNPDQIQYNCLQPSNFIQQGLDCNDLIASINPDGIEVCNGMDDDCDGHWDAGQLGLDVLCPASNCKDIQTVDSSLDDGLYFINITNHPSATCSDELYTNQSDCEAVAGCSDSSFTTETECSIANETWSPRWGVIEEVHCDMGSFSGGWTLVFSDDMSPPDPNWTLQQTSFCGSWGEILGGYGVISGPNHSNGGEFSNIISTKGIEHTELWVEMDYITLDSWDDINDPVHGPDMAYVGFNGNDEEDYFWHTDVDNHLSIYGQVCGWSGPQIYTQDSRHYVSTIESGYFPQISLYVGSTLSQHPYDESFGLDNVYVWVR